MKTNNTMPSVFSYMDKLIVQKRAAGKAATADLYRATRNWLQKMNGGKITLTLAAITPRVVDCFRDFLLSQGTLKTNSINSYLSNFRAMYNTAVREGLVRRTIAPFDHLTLRMEKTAKRAIRVETIEELASLGQQSSPELEQAVDFGLFSFLACGIPFVDLAHLTRRHIINGELVYNRIKTGTSIHVKVLPGMQRLIEKYACPDSLYLFPILPADPSQQSYEHYKNALARYNKHLAQLSRQLSTPTAITSYTFRHTWATEALRQHIPVSIISQALGHTSEKTTRSYLAELDQSELDLANAIITERIDCLVGK